MVRMREACHGDRVFLSIFVGAGKAAAATPNMAMIAAASM
jgi:hypothetical protein